MLDRKTLAVAAGGLLIYQGWMDANATAATTTNQVIGWAAVALGALLIFESVK